MERNESRYISGSYTVEMALLLPIILGVLVFCLGLTFYVYDLCMLNISANQAAVEGRKYAAMSDRNKERKIKKLAQSEVSDCLIAVENLQTIVQVEGEKISVSYSGAYTFPVINSLLGGTDTSQNITGRGHSVLQDPVRWIRNVRKVGRIADYIKGSEE